MPCHAEVLFRSTLHALLESRRVPCASASVSRGRRLDDLQAAVLRDGRMVSQTSEWNLAKTPPFSSIYPLVFGSHVAKGSSTDTLLAIFMSSASYNGTRHIFRCIRLTAASLHREAWPCVSLVFQGSLSARL